MNQAKKLKEQENRELRGKERDPSKGLLRPTFEELHIREIDMDPPEIYGKNSFGLKRLVTDRIMTDSTHHKNGEIKK